MKQNKNELPSNPLFLYKISKVLYIIQNDVFEILMTWTVSIYMSTDVFFSHHLRMSRSIIYIFVLYN